MLAVTVKQIDEGRLDNDLPYRFGYLSEFMEFGEKDIAAIHASAEYLAPRVDGLVDAVYEKLFSFDATKRHFVPRQHGYEGSVPTDVDSLDLADPQIAFRKQHLKNYLLKLVTAPYDAKMLTYLDVVGRIHTEESGSNEIAVPLVQMNALMGFVSTALLSTIMTLDLDDETQLGTVAAFNKLLWLQNDFIQKWYTTG